jgi:hypothetical protein
LGLEQYAPAFRDNDVDGEVLPQMTADDSISIGVTSVGHRRSCSPQCMACLQSMFGTIRLTQVPSIEPGPLLRVQLAACHSEASQ